jgi:type III pantothenate kinase
MLLAVDVGNTHTVLGVFDGEALRAHWRIATRRDATSDELGVLLRSLLPSASLSAGEVTGVVVSSVVPDVDATIARMTRDSFGFAPMFVEPGIRTGMPILYDNPKEVGADRIVNAVAAVHRYGSPILVLDFGTATTFDVVSAKGEYLGGVIAPGLRISADALFERAARLSPVEVKKPPRVIGRNTQESVQAGLFHGYVGLVEGIVRKLRAELQAEARVVATGGLAPVFEGELTCLTAVDPDLTLLGLRLLWEKNRR